MANFEGRDTKIGGNVGPIFAMRRAKGFFKSPKGNFLKLDLTINIRFFDILHSKNCQNFTDCPNWLKICTIVVHFIANFLVPV